MGKHDNLPICEVPGQRICLGSIRCYPEAYPKSRDLAARTGHIYSVNRLKSEAMNWDKLDDYYLFFAALVPIGMGGVIALLSGLHAAEYGLVVLVACVILPVLDHFRANVTDDSKMKRVRSWIYLITSCGVMGLLLLSSTSIYNPTSWLGITALFLFTWFAVAKFSKAVGVQLDPLDKMYLASGEIFGFFTPAIVYLTAAILQALPLLRAGSPAIPALFLVVAWTGGFFALLVVKTEIISKKLLILQPETLLQRRGRSSRLVRVIEEHFPYLNFALMGMAAESGLRNPRVLATFVLSAASFALLALTVPHVSSLGWQVITVQCVIADSSLVANLAFYTQLSTADVMKGSWLPRF